MRVIFFSMAIVYCSLSIDYLNDYIEGKDKYDLVNFILALICTILSISLLVSFIRNQW